jgi:TldD protein
VACFLKQTKVQLAPVRSPAKNANPIKDNEPFLASQLATKPGVGKYERLLAYGDRGIKKPHSFLRFTREDKGFASTVGSVIEQGLHLS